MAGKICLVTGGTRGFGAAIVSRFVEQGARCLVMDLLAEDGWYDAYSVCAPHDAGAAAAAAASSGSGSDANAASDRSAAPAHSAYALKADITQRTSWLNALSTCLDVFAAPPTIVVNNAGWTYSNQPSLHVTEQDFDRVFEVNVKSVFWSVDVLLPKVLEATRGKADACWVNVSSTAALRPRPGLVWCKCVPHQELWPMK